MVSSNDLINALDPIFSGSLGQTPNLSAGGQVAASDVVYECYLYSLVVKALDELQYSPTANPAGGGPFVFRRGRGKLWTLKRDCSFVEFTANGIVYELLCDVEVLCRSPNVDLEVDVLILPKGHSDRCVTKRSSPNFAELRLLIEAKHHAVGVNVVTAKTFVGVCNRLRATRCVASLVTSGAKTANADRLLSGVNPKIELFDSVYGDPQTSNSARAFIDSLKNQLPNKL